MKKEKNVSKEKPNKVKQTIRFFLSIVMILTIGFIILNYVPAISKYDQFVIVTDSMEPIINIGDVVIMDTSVEADEIEIGTIVAVHADINDDGHDEVVVHYLHSVTVEGQETVYRTISEAGDSVDPWTLSADDILGVHVLTIRNIGSFLLFAQSSIGRIVLIMDVVVIFIIMELLGPDKKKKEKETIEEEMVEE